MKPSAVAVALLAAPIGGAAQHAGGAPAPLYKKMKSIRGSSSVRPRDARLLTGNGPNESDMLATCGALSSDSDCNSNKSCTWCVSGAVPSACYPSSMTSRLAAGVFDCSGGERAAGAAASSAEAVMESFSPPQEKPKGEKAEKKKAKETFNLKAGVTLTLDSAEVDGDFCDASSPLSLAGYMTGEFTLFF